MSVAQTSIDAHHGNLETNLYGTQRERILDAIRQAGPMNRREIMNYTGIEAGAVNGRVNELIKEGELEPGHKAKCTITGRTVEVVILAGTHIPMPPVEAKLKWITNMEKNIAETECGNFSVEREPQDEYGKVFVYHLRRCKMDPMDPRIPLVYYKGTYKTFQDAQQRAEELYASH